MRTKLVLHILLTASLVCFACTRAPDESSGNKNASAPGFIKEAFNFSKTIPIFPGSKFVFLTDEEENGEKLGGGPLEKIIHLSADNDCEEVFEWYKNSVKKEGWKVVEIRACGVVMPGQIKAMSKGHTLAVSIYKGEKTGIIGVIYQSPKKETKAAR